MADENTSSAPLNRVRLAVETSRVQPQRLAAYHGEDVAIEFEFRNYGAPCSLDGGEAHFYWRTAADETGYWHEAGDADISGAVVTVRWGPSMDSGQDSVEWYLKVVADDGSDTASYRAAGSLRLIPSPGFVPAILPPAKAVLDFDLVTVLHAPYYVKSETYSKAEADMAFMGASAASSDMAHGGIVIDADGMLAVSAGTGLEVGSSGELRISDNVVRSVCDETPDERGNVALDADDVGALPVSGGTVRGDLFVSGNDDDEMGSVQASHDVVAGHDLFINGQAIHFDMGVQDYADFTPESWTFEVVDSNDQVSTVTKLVLAAPAQNQGA